MAITIRREDNTTYTMVCSAFLRELEPVFEKCGFQYEVLFGDAIPDDVRREVELGGHIQRVGVCCIKSHMNSEDVHQLMLRVWMPSRYGAV